MDYNMTMRDFDPTFRPDLSPQEMLKLGIFGGAYFKPEDRDELPTDWFTDARISDHGPDPHYNYFEVSASQPLRVWQDKGWIYPEDPLGWFQWYCRYYLGRRIPDEDRRQIGRWRAIRRHIGQLQAACQIGDFNCRPRQRQALLHWAYASRKL
jgi:hypothetical protein